MPKYGERVKARRKKELKELGINVNKKNSLS